MRVDIKTGGDGETCWNRQAITDYAAQVTEREAQLTQRNPDLAVAPGRISCYGCEAQEYGYGVKCTAKITKTVYTVPGEVKPRAADAEGWHREIPGLLSIKPDSGDMTAAGPALDAAAGASPTSPVPAQPVAPQPVPARRGLFGRRS